jgi:hypothetical protein
MTEINGRIKKRSPPFVLVRKTKEGGGRGRPLRDLFIHNEVQQRTENAPQVFYWSGRHVISLNLMLCSIQPILSTSRTSGKEALGITVKLGEPCIAASFWLVRWSSWSQRIKALYVIRELSIFPIMFIL